MSKKCEALYDKAVLPADAEGSKMRWLELDCAFETICETCTYFAVGVEFRPTLGRQLNDATRKGQEGRQRLYSGLLADIEEVDKGRPEP